MSKEYDEFKSATLKADTVITQAKEMNAVSEDFADGFHKAMWEAREIYMRLEDAAERAASPTTN
jgi:hypothetical protein